MTFAAPPWHAIVRSGEPWTDEQVAAYVREHGGVCACGDSGISPDSFCVACRECVDCCLCGENFAPVETRTAHA